MDRWKIIFGTMCVNWLVLVPMTFSMMYILVTSPDQREALMSGMTSGFLAVGFMYGVLCGLTWFVLSMISRQPHSDVRV